MLVNSHTAGDPKPESANTESSTTNSKKKRKPKKPKSTETSQGNSEPAPSVNKENDEAAANPSDKKKKKKRNNKKKPDETSEEKSDNLISTTFQALKGQNVKDKTDSALNGVVLDQNKATGISHRSTGIKQNTVKKTGGQKNDTTKTVTTEEGKQKQSKSQIKSNNKSPLRQQNTVIKDNKVSNEVNTLEGREKEEQKKKNTNKKKKSSVEEGKAVENKTKIQKKSDVEGATKTTQIASDNSQQQKVDKNKKSSNQKPKSGANIKPPPGSPKKVNNEEEKLEEHQNKPKKKKNKNKKQKSGISPEDSNTESQKNSQNLPLGPGITKNEPAIAVLKNKFPDNLKLKENTPEKESSSKSVVSVDECDFVLPKKEESQPNKPLLSPEITSQADQKLKESTTIKNKEEGKNKSNSDIYPSAIPMDATQKDKNREDVRAAREAKRLAKLQAKKAKGEGKTKVDNENVTVSLSNDKNANVVNDSALPTTNHSSNKTSKEKIDKKEGIKNEKIVSSSKDEKADKSRESILAEREAKKLAKKAGKDKGKGGDEPGTPAEKKDKGKGGDEPGTPAEKKDNANVTAKQKDENKVLQVDHAVPESSEEEKKKATTKAERRAIQEAQRAAKAKALAEMLRPPAKIKTDTPPKKDATTLELKKVEKAATITSPNKPRTFKVKLFNHLQAKIGEQNCFVNNQQLHPAMVKLGEQYSKRTVVGSNARCLAFLDALKTVIQDYETPPKKEFARGLEAIVKNCVDHLQKCRPLAVSVYNAYRYIKMVLTKLPPNQLESDLKKELVELIENYIKDQIEKAAQGISYYVQGKITNGDVILTYGCSSLINYILEEAHSRQVNFRVVVVDSRPYCEGQELLRRLISKGISCTCVLINAVGFVMPEITKVLLGAHALLANGYVMSRTGTAQVALVAKSFNVPVLVCCETHKFSERVQTDAIVYNELGDPNDLISKTKDCKLTNWKSYPSLYPLNLNYDVTPPELVTAVVTEIRFLPCTSAPVILRIRPSEMLS